MITKYSEYIKENYIIKPEDFDITDYIFKDGILDVNESVDISHNSLEELPFEFGKINGNFRCQSNKLTTLKGCPKEVNGEFNCFGNKLTSLEYCPQIVKTNFSCHSNPLDGIDDYPVCIIYGPINSNDFWSSLYNKINKLIKLNIELFIPLLYNKKAFHQMIMILEPSYIKYYKTIPPPPKKSVLLF